MGYNFVPMAHFLLLTVVSHLVITLWYLKLIAGKLCLQEVIHLEDPTIITIG
jgi:hypothetical protein